MRPREFLALFAGLGSVPPVGAAAQPGNQHRVAFVGAGPSVTQLRKRPRMIAW